MTGREGSTEEGPAVPLRCVVLLFAGIAEAVGEERVEVELREGATVDDALDALAREHAAIAEQRASLAVAVDERYARRDDVLRDGCVLALIPPVSGG